MKNTKRFFAYLAITALQSYGTDSMLNDALDSQNSNAILRAAIITTVGFAANCYVGHKLTKDMTIEVIDKIEELHEKKRQREVQEVIGILEEV